MIKKSLLITMISSSLFLAGNAWAGKPEDIQAEVKKTCGKDISSEEALRLVKQLYLSCVEGTKVEVNSGCSVNCMKSAGGKVIGQ